MRFKEGVDFKYDKSGKYIKKSSWRYLEYCDYRKITSNTSWFPHFSKPIHLYIGDRIYSDDFDMYGVIESIIYNRRSYLIFCIVQWDKHHHYYDPPSAKHFELFNKIKDEYNINGISRTVIQFTPEEFRVERPGIYKESNEDLSYFLCYNCKNSFQKNELEYKKYPNDCYHSYCVECLPVLLLEEDNLKCPSSECNELFELSDLSENIREIFEPRQNPIIHTTSNTDIKEDYFNNGLNNVDHEEVKFKEQYGKNVQQDIIHHSNIKIKLSAPFNDSDDESDHEIGGESDNESEDDDNESDDDDDESDNDSKNNESDSDVDDNSDDENEYENNIILKERYNKKDLSSENHNDEMDIIYLFPDGSINEYNIKKNLKWCSFLKDIYNKILEKNPGMLFEQEQLKGTNNNWEDEEFQLQRILVTKLPKKKYLKKIKRGKKMQFKKEDGKAIKSFLELKKAGYDSKPWLLLVSIENLEEERKKKKRKKKEKKEKEIISNTIKKNYLEEEKIDDNEYNQQDMNFNEIKIKQIEEKNISDNNLKYEIKFQESTNISDPVKLKNIQPLSSLLTLVNEYHSPFIKEKVFDLGKDFRKWRRIRGDGNCYYRAIAFGAIETMIRRGNYKKLNHIISKLREVEYDEKDNWNDQEKLISFLQIISNQLKEAIDIYHQNNNDWESFIKDSNIINKELEEHFNNNENIDLALISCCRNLIYSFLKKNQNSRITPNDPKSMTYHDFTTSQGYDCESWMKENLIRMGEEAESIIVDGGILQKILGITSELIIFHRDQKKISTIIRPNENELPEVYLFFKPGHYDLLYPDHKDELEFSGVLPVPRSRFARYKILEDNSDFNNQKINQFDNMNEKIKKKDSLEDLCYKNIEELDLNKISINNNNSYDSKKNDEDIVENNRSFNKLNKSDIRDDDKIHDMNFDKDEDHENISRKNYDIDENDRSFDKLNQSIIREDDKIHYMNFDKDEDHENISRKNYDIDENDRSFDKLNQSYSNDSFNNDDSIFNENEDPENITRTNDDIVENESYLNDFEKKYQIEQHLENKKYNNNTNFENYNYKNNHFYHTNLESNHNLFGRNKYDKGNLIESGLFLPSGYRNNYKLKRLPSYGLKKHQNN